MVDANENENENGDVAKSQSIPEMDAIEEDEAPLNSSSNVGEEEDEDEDEEEYGDDDDDDEEEEGGDDEEDPEEQEPEQEREQEEKVDNGVNAVAVVKNEEPETTKENDVKEDEKKAKEPETSEKSGEKSKSKEKKRGAKNKNKKQDEQKESVTVVVNGDKPEPSSKKKGGSKRVESMGMVFMCSSKTKADCFRYKILGLPENKKDQVLKIYKGMRLFLFDVDLRLMYGIFKAAGPGGYNIEPRAFKSEFPSQVRFTVLDDCVPLAEENFKHVLKENYYTRNKFESLLKSDQVKKLCKLFVRMGKGGGRSKSAVKASRAQPIEPRRIRARETRKRRDRDEERRPRSLSPPVRETRRYADYDHDRPRVLYDHEPPLPRYHPGAPPAPIGSPVRLYPYERQPLDIPPYARDHVPKHHPFCPLDRDPYPGYSREPPLYRDAVYTMPPEHHVVSRDYNHPPAVQPPEYHNHMAGGSRLANYRDAEIVRDYRAPALPLPDYRSRPRYRY